MKMHVLAHNGTDQPVHIEINRDDTVIVPPGELRSMWATPCTPPVYVAVPSLRDGIRSLRIEFPIAPTNGGAVTVQIDEDGISKD